MSVADTIIAYYAASPWHQRAAAHLVTHSLLLDKLDDEIDDGKIGGFGPVPGQTLGWSANESHLAHLAWSLFAGDRISLRDTLEPGLDDRSVEAIVGAVRVALTGRAG